MPDATGDKSRRRKKRAGDASAASTAPRHADKAAAVAGSDDAAAWLTYTAPDGRPYYYNSVRATFVYPVCIWSLFGADSDGE